MSYAAGPAIDPSAGWRQRGRLLDDNDDDAVDKILAVMADEGVADTIRASLTARAPPFSGEAFVRTFRHVVSGLCAARAGDRRRGLVAGRTPHTRGGTRHPPVGGRTSADCGRARCTTIQISSSLMRPRPRSTNCSGAAPTSKRSSRWRRCQDAHPVLAPLATSRLTPIPCAARLR